MPVAATAWVFGLGWGIAGAIFATALTTGQLFYVLDESGAALVSELPRHANTPLALLVGAGLAGWVSGLKRELRTYKRATSEAQYDALTGLLGRQSFIERLRLVLEKSRSKNVMAAVLFVDLDKFKFVNDTYGHDAGDELLRQVARILKETVRQEDVVARLGGDEFMLVLTDLKEPRAAAYVASKIVKALNSPFKILGKNVSIGASVGIAIYPDDGDSAEVLIKAADVAMYAVKAAGKNAYELQTSKTRALEVRRLEFEKYVQVGFDNREFELYYQPQVALEGRKLLSFEALLRWRSPVFGLVTPTEFLTVAEGVGLLADLDHWALREACRQLSQWHRAGFKPLKIALNVSAMQFSQPGFVEKVKKAVADNDINPAWLELELTEKLVAADHRQALKTLTALDKLGLKLTLDNFGSGYSAMHVLQRLPVTGLKVDKRFVRQLGPDVRTPEAKIVEAVCALGKTLGKTMTAEGVETLRQHDVVKKLGFSRAQGYYYAKPLATRDAERLLKRLRPSEDDSLISTGS